MLNDEAKAKARGRLRRIEGQVQGLQRMIEGDAYCVDVLLQISAVQGALEQVQKLLLGRHIESCVADALRTGSRSSASRKSRSCWRYSPASEALMAERLTLPVRGMHCAACVGKVERALAGVSGVESASVNLATERATVAFDPTRTAVPALQTAVAAAGYELAPAPIAHGEAEDHERAERARELEALKRRVVIGALLSVPIVIGSMPDVFSWAPAWLRDPRVLLALTVPVQFWVGAEFHRGFLRDLRHRSASMDTLVSLGTNAAFFFSVAVTLWPHVFHAAGAMTYYETAAVVITLVVLGRWLEARARGRTSEAIRRLVSLAPRTARVRRASGEVEIPTGEVEVGDLIRVRPGERIPVDGVVSRAPPRSTSRCSPARACRSTRRRATGVRWHRQPHRQPSSSAATRSAPRRRSPGSSGSWRRRRARKAPIQRLADRVAAVFVPVVLGDRGADVRRLVAARPAPALAARARQRRGGAGHRLPVRARPGDADGHHGRHRPRRRARRADPERRGARALRSGRRPWCSTRPAR